MKRKCLSDLRILVIQDTKWMSGFYINFIKVEYKIDSSSLLVNLHEWEALELLKIYLLPCRSEEVMNLSTATQEPLQRSQASWPSQFSRNMQDRKEQENQKYIIS